MSNVNVKKVTVRKTNNRIDVSNPELFTMKDLIQHAFDNTSCNNEFEAIDLYHQRLNKFIAQEGNEKKRVELQFYHYMLTQLRDTLFYLRTREIGDATTTPYSLN